MHIKKGVCEVRGGEGIGKKHLYPLIYKETGTSRHTWKYQFYGEPIIPGVCLACVSFCITSVKCVSECTAIFKEL